MLSMLLKTKKDNKKYQHCCSYSYLTSFSIPKRQRRFVASYELQTKSPAQFHNVPDTLTAIFATPGNLEDRDDQQNMINGSHEIKGDFYGPAINSVCIANSLQTIPTHTGGSDGPVDANKSHGGVGPTVIATAMLDG